MDLFLSKKRAALWPWLFFALAAWSTHANKGGVEPRVVRRERRARSTRSGHTSFLELVRQATSLNEVESRGLRVALVGDSITFGNGSLSDYTPLEKRWRGSYPKAVQVAFEQCGSGKEEIRMFALGGTTGLMGQHLSRDGRHSCTPEHGRNPTCSFWDTNSFQNLLHFQPDVVVIGFGTNDAKEELQILRKAFAADMSALVKRVAASKTFILIPAPVRIDGRMRISNHALNSVVRPTLKGIVEQFQTSSPAMDVSAIDLAGILANGRAYGDERQPIVDGVHPAHEGSFAMSQCVLSRMLNDRGHVGDNLGNVVKEWHCDRPSDCCTSTWCPHDQGVGN